MGKINWQRVFLGGLLFAVVYNAISAVSVPLFITSWRAALQAVGLQAVGFPFEITAEIFIPFLLLTVVVGIFAVWFYAAIRPRYGPGPKTAACAGFAVWVIGALLPSIAWGKLTVHLPTGVLAAALAADLVAIVVATLAGAWPYKE